MSHSLHMPTVTHAGHVFNLLVISQILDYRLQFFKSVTRRQNTQNTNTIIRPKCHGCCHFQWQKHKIAPDKSFTDSYDIFL